MLSRVMLYTCYNLYCPLRMTNHFKCTNAHDLLVQVFDLESTISEQPSLVHRSLTYMYGVYTLRYVQSIYSIHTHILH